MKTTVIGGERDRKVTIYQRDILRKNGAFGIVTSERGDGRWDFLVCDSEGRRVFDGTGEMSETHAIAAGRAWALQVNRDARVIALC